jgi:histidinol-phosphate phosphatase family protein
MRKAVFVNDGTLMDNSSDNIEAALIRLKPFAVNALKMLQSAGYTIIVISEQPAVAYGLAEAAVERMRQYLEALLMMFSVRIGGYYYCPHDPAGSVAAYARVCECRRPAPGLLLRAAGEHQIDLNASWLLGSARQDRAVAGRAGCRAALVIPEMAELLHTDGAPAESNDDAVFEDICSAAEHILAARPTIGEDCYAKAAERSAAK